MRAMFRALMLLWAIVQIAVPTIVAVADSSESATRLAAHAHVEDRSHGTCVPVHGSDCILCQHLNGLAALRSNSPAEVLFALATAQAAGALVASRAPELRGLSVPRGPPAIRVG
jgi:hypothetical protein